MMEATVDQSSPTSAPDGVPGAHELACRDLMERADVGLARYGTRLHPNNGRSNLTDLYQEVLDTVAYVRNLISQLELNDSAQDRAVLLPNGRVAVRCSGSAATHSGWKDDDPQAWVTTEPISYPDGKYGLQLCWFRDSEVPPGSIPLAPVLSLLDVESTVDRDELYERCAAIEHARWGRWQRYVHTMGRRQPDGSIVLEPRHVKKWERLADADYADLTDEEKEGDRAQVAEYWEAIFGRPYVRGEAV